MFYRHLLVFTALILGVVVVLRHLLHWQGIHPHAIQLILFFALLAAFIYRFVKNGSERNPENFNNYFMGSVVMRFFVCIGVFVVYLILHSGTNLVFALNYMVFYFLFTGFEIYHIVRNLRPFSKNPQG